MSGEDLFQEPQVFITISSAAGISRCKCGKEARSLARRLELNWNNFNDYQSGDVVALFDFDPNEKDEQFMAKSISELAKESKHVNGVRGYLQTKVKFKRESSSANGKVYLGWWIAYLRRSGESSPWKIIKSNAFIIRPFWMKELKDVIGNIPLLSIMIPGTHDSGAWMEYNAACCGCARHAHRFYICQEETVYDQLLHGIRYLDARVGYYPKTNEKFWINHDKIRIRPLMTLLDDVKRFVGETNEIVILDFHRFPVGVTSEEIHKELFQAIWDVLGEHMAPKSVSSADELTPNMLWQIKKTLIVTYADGETSNNNEYLWRSVKHVMEKNNQIQI